MKLITLIAGILFSASIYSQADTTCVNANAIDTSTTGMQQVSSFNKWYTYIAQSDSSKVSLFNHNYSSDELIVKFEVYSGNCSGLTLLAKDSISSLSDSLLEVIVNQTPSSIYYIKITKIATTSTVNFSLNVKALMPPCGSCADAPSWNCNLVCNGNFESNVAIPTNIAQIHYACPWETATLWTPDYFHASAPTSPPPSVSVPNNIMGSQLSYNSGGGDVAYAGLICYQSSGLREYMYQKLKAPLITGACYTVSMYMSRADNYKYQLNDIGMYLSTIDPYTGTGGGPIPYFPAQTVMCSGYITSATAWTLVTGTYIALGGEQYLTIGRFGTGATFTIGSGTISEAYYYFDQVSVVPNSFTIAAAPSPTCLGQTVNLTTTSCSAVTWSSTPGSSFSPAVGLTSTAAPSAAGTTTFTGSVTFIPTTPGPGCIISDSEPVTVNPKPPVAVTSTAICIGQTATLTAGGATTYTWSAGVSPTTGATVTATPTTTTSYTVTGTLASTGCTNTAVATVTVNPLPVVTVNSPTICNGQSATLTAAGATTYSWSTGAIINPIIVSPTSTTSYTVTGTTTGCSGTAVSTVTVNPVPVATATPSSQTFCSGSTTGINLTSVPVGATFAWTVVQTNVSGAIGGSGASIAQILNTTTFSPGTAVYTITPTLAGCSGTPITVTITVNPNPNVVVPANATYCIGDIVPAFTSTIAGTTYTWTNSNTATGLVATSGTGNVPSFTATNSGTTVLTSTITVTPTDPATGCVGTPTAYTITVNPRATVIAISNISQCAGTTVSASTFTSVPAGATFTWTNSDPSIGLLASGTGNTPSFTAINTGTTPITATITVTPSLGACIGVFTTYTITVNPIPTLSGVPASTFYCDGDIVPATSLTGSIIGTTFNWTNSNIFIGLGSSGSGNVPSFTAGSFSGTTTGIITITPTANGCPGPSVSYTITVNPYPIMSIPLDIMECAGTVIPMSNFMSSPAGATFAWTNSNTAIGLGASGSGDVPSFTLTNPTASPLSGTITVTPTFGGICVGTPITYTITVFPSPTITASATPSTISLGASSTLTAAGGISTGYTWSTGATINPYTVVPIATTTYTVTGTNQYGCTSTGTVTVTVVNYPCNATIPTTFNPLAGGTIPDGSTSAALFPGGNANGNFRIVGTFIVNSNLTTVNCNFIMDQTGVTVPNIQVILGSGLAPSTLTLAQNTHLYSCTTMWDGIYITPACKLVLQDNVIIEDAFQAVNIAQGAQQCLINRTIFNKNLYGIKLPANNNTSISPIDVTNSIFTTRYLIYTSALPSGMPSVSAVKPDLAMATPPLSVANLLPPNAGRKGYVGIDATDVSYLVVGDPLPVSPPASRNIFDAIMTGINIENPTKPNTTAYIYHNTFQFILGIGAPCMSGFPCTFSRGFGINAAGMNNTGSNKITVGGTLAQGNTFRNIYRAVNISNYQTVTAQRNTITNTSTGPFPPSVVNYGNGGIFVVPAAQASNILIADQTLIKNCATAIWVSHGAGAVTGPSLLRINKNGDGTSTAPGITSDGTSSGYCTNGIYVTDLLSLSTPHGLWEVRENFIKLTDNCIYLTNVKKPVSGLGSATVYDLFSNSCNTRYLATGVRTGIRASGAKGISITNNHTNYTPGSAAYVYPTGNIKAYGLYLQQSTNMYVGCNLFENAGRSMVFEGNCTSTSLPGFGITKNTMRRAQDGFVLKNNGIIGTQGSSTVASNNFWDMSAAGAPNFTFSEIFTDATGGLPSNANVFSKLYMNNITTGATATMPVTIPAASSLSKTNGVVGTDNYLVGTGLNITSAVSTPCTGTPPPALASSSMSPAEISSHAAFLKTIEEDSTLLPLYNDETRWQRRKYVFDEVDENPVYAVNPGLANFHAVNMGSPFDKFSLVDKKIALGQYAAASSINNSITPTNIVESNQQTVNNQILQQLLVPGYIYSAVDISILSAIAYQCPLQGGNSVYQARVLLMNIANDVIEFFDNCDKEVVRSMDSTPQSIGNEVASAYKLFPNPNDGNMTLEYSLSETSTGTFMLYDVTGRLVFSYVLTPGENISLKISESELQNGIYFYNIIIDNKVKAQNKIVIVK